MVEVDEDRLALANYRMEDAWKAICSAKALYQIEDYKGANNRAYYACYYAIVAVLAIEKIAFKRHKDTVAYFNRNYVHGGVFPAEFGHKLHMIKEVREKSDYDDFYILNKNDTKEQIELAEHFFDLVQEYLHGEYGLEKISKDNDIPNE